jgi:hypothetical protein
VAAALTVVASAHLAVRWTVLAYRSIWSRTRPRVVAGAAANLMLGVPERRRVPEDQGL